MTHKILLTFLLVTSITISGCKTSTTYQYQSIGNLKTKTDKDLKTVIWWNYSKNRTWYGRNYSILDSTVKMRMCGLGAWDFSLDDDHLLSLLSEEDTLVAEIVDGKFILLKEEMLVIDGSVCGRILIKNEIVGVNTLVEGVNPEVTLLCKKTESKDSHPIAAKYLFNKITRQDTKGEIITPKTCIANE